MKLNRTATKYIAAAAMLLDHIGMMFVPVTTVLGALLRIVGRLAAPIFCMFVAEGFCYTSSKFKYGLRLFLFAVVSQFAYSFAHYNKVFVFHDYNMMFTLFLSFMCLVSMVYIKNVVLRYLAVFGLVALSVFCDWGMFAPVWVLMFYLLRQDKKKLTVFFCVTAVLVALSSIAFCVKNGYHWYGELWQLGLFLFVPIIFLYDGQKCPANLFHKWFFYLFYPVHLALLALLAMFV